MLKKTLLLLAVAACAAVTQASAQTLTLLAGYDFQTTTNGGTAAAVAPASPLTYLASFGTQAGTAAIYLDGTHGSSLFTTPSTGGEVTGVGGTAVNAGTGFSTVTTSPSALSLRGGTAQSGNGKSLVFTLSMTGYQSLVLTFAAQRSGTGFTGNTFSYSTDGTTFIPMTGTIVPAAAYATVTEDFSSVTALNNAPTVYIAYTLAGATGSTGSNFLDNIQFNAVPEPSTYAYLIGALGMLVVVCRRRRRV